MSEFYLIFLSGRCESDFETSLGCECLPRRENVVKKRTFFAKKVLLFFNVKREILA